MPRRRSRATGVGLCVAVVDAADLVDDAGCVEQPFGERGLTGVDVSEDPQVEVRTERHVHPAEHHLSEGHDVPCAHSTWGSWHTSTPVRPRLTERLLYAAGVIDEIGSVDDGSTQTDTLALERQRGITIKSAVVSFVVDDVTVNLIDTPGHPDFIAEVERVLSVLDGAVLVVSAVEGVQAQTRILMRTLQRLRIPTLHLREQDRPWRRPKTARAADMAEKLTPATIAMGTTREIGTRRAVFTPYDAADASSRPSWAPSSPSTTMQSLPRSRRRRVPYCRLREQLAAQTARRWCIRCSSARRSRARAWMR